MKNFAVILAGMKRSFWPDLVTFSFYNIDFALMNRTHHLHVPVSRSFFFFMSPNKVSEISL